MNGQDYIKLEKEYGATNYKPLDVVLTRGKGIWVWDVEGNRYLDCPFGILRCQPGTLPSQDSRRHEGAG